MEHRRPAEPDFAPNDFVPQWMKKEHGKTGRGGKGFEHGAGVDRPVKNKKPEDRSVRDKPGFQQRVHRQRSLDHPEGVRNPGRYRHYSNEDDYYHYAAPPFYDGYPPYSSPSPPSYPFRMVNGSGSGNYMYGDPNYFYNTPPGGYGPPRAHRGGRGRRERERSGGDMRRDDRHDDNKQIDFNTEFPSLNGEVDKTSNGTSNGNSQNSTQNTAWVDSKSGVHVVTSKGKNDDKEDKSNVFKALIPAKVSIARRGQELSKSKEGSLRPSSAVSQKKPVPIQILSASVKMTQPKKLGNKTKFLKALKSEKPGSEQTNGNGENREDLGSEAIDVPNGREPLVNGIDCNGVNSSDHLLSTSLEKEQRLLREMGWHESDDEDYEITEDEKRLFQLQLEQKQRSRSGDEIKLRNGINGMHRLLTALPNGSAASGVVEANDSAHSDH